MSRLIGAMNAMNNLSRALHAEAETDRAARIKAAPAAPGPWLDVELIPKNGTLIDVRFDIASAEPGMAEFYAPGCTKAQGQLYGVIENVAYLNFGFVPVIDLAGARAIELAAGQPTRVDGVGHAIMSVTIVSWRTAAYPPVS